MGFLRDIFRAFFCKSKKQEQLDKTNIEQPYMQVVYKKENKKVIGGYKSGDTQPDKSKSCSYKDVTQTFCEPNFTPKSYGVCNPSAIIPNGDDFFASEELIEKEKRMDDEVNNVCIEVKNEVNISSSNKPKIFNTKREKLINHLLETSSGITKKEASEKFKINRLDTMVYNLRKKGYVFETSHSVGNIYVYYLISTPKK
jgi:hypothetical protein